MARKNAFNQTTLGVIKMTVMDDSNFLSPYCYYNPLISEEVAEFLKRERKLLRPPVKKLQIVIRSNVISEEEKVVYTHAIHNYFDAENKEDKILLKRTRFIALWMGIVGVLGFAALVILDSLFTLGIWEAIIDILGWVFVWEAIDQYFLEGGRMKQDYFLSNLFAKAEISFEEIEEKNG